MLYVLQLLHLGCRSISLGLIFVCVFERRILLINSEVLKVISVAWNGGFAEMLGVLSACCSLIKGKNCALHVTGVHPEGEAGPPLRG